MSDRMARAACIALLACIPFALYGINLDDYFVGDDFDFLVSIHEKPAGTSPPACGTTRPGRCGRTSASTRRWAEAICDR